MVAVMRPSRTSSTGVSWLLVVMSFLLFVVGVIPRPLTESWRMGMSARNRGGPRGSAAGRNRGARASNVTGTEGKRRVLARVGARSPAGGADARGKRRPTGPAFKRSEVRARSVVRPARRARAFVVQPACLHEAIAAHAPSFGRVCRGGCHSRPFFARHGGPRLTVSRPDAKRGSRGPSRWRRRERRRRRYRTACRRFRS